MTLGVGSRAVDLASELVIHLHALGESHRTDEGLVKGSERRCTDVSRVEGAPRPPRELLYVRLVA